LMDRIADNELCFLMLKDPCQRVVFAALNNGTPLAFRCSHVVGKEPDRKRRLLNNRMRFVRHESALGVAK
jgi:hypothetical protein